MMLTQNEPTQNQTVMIWNDADTKWANTESNSDDTSYLATVQLDFDSPEDENQQILN